ncbi:MAG: glycogen synthase GlgA [Thermodesulfovibrionales bacterium]|nr:glycogen synthase GlgA [Thermodesulfovibrionales bacterium]
MKVLIAASEAEPFAKTGGLADVTGSLLRELVKIKADAMLIMPLYRTVRERFALKDTGLAVKVPIGDTEYSSRVFSAPPAAQPRVFFVECDAFFDREELYGTLHGDYEDNALRFIFFSRAVLEACRAMALRPDVIHCNDWQTGLIPLYMRTLYKNDFGSAQSLFTIHNLGYQGIFPLSVSAVTGLGPEFFTPSGMEFYGQVNFMKSGIVFSTGLNTVSGNYSKEILTPDYGFGLDGVLKDRAEDLRGILNGIDCDLWNPAKDPMTAANYSTGDISGKASCKSELLRECGLEGQRPLLAMVGRLSSQKGIDIFLEAAGRIISDGCNIVILGRGDEEYEKGLEALARKYPGRVSLHLGHDEAFAHRVYAGSDIIVIPSRYEPCGLTQMIAHRYGTVPVARQTGGLADTIEDYDHLKGSGTGFLFADYTPDALRRAIGRSLCVYANLPAWKGVVVSGMKKDFSWRSSAKKYLSLYESLSGVKR